MNFDSGYLCENNRCVMTMLVIHHDELEYQNTTDNPDNEKSKKTPKQFKNVMKQPETLTKTKLFEEKQGARHVF